MTRFLLFASVICAIFLQISNLEACGELEDVILFDEIREEASGLIRWAGIEYGVSITNLELTSPYRDVVDVLTGQDRPLGNWFGFTTGPNFPMFLDTYPRLGSFNASLKFTCHGESAVQRDITVVFEFLDANNKPTEFNVKEMTFTIPSNWNRTIPLNLEHEIVTSDADYSVDNARLTLIASPDIFGFVTRPLWQVGEVPSPSYDTDVLVYLKLEADIPDGITNVTVNAWDGLYFRTLNILLEVQEVN